MGLSCSCREWDGEGICYDGAPEDFTVLETSTRKRCVSCKNMIGKNNPVLEFKRFRAPKSEVEIKIWGEDGEIILCNHYLCEKCGEIFLNLEAAGYCIFPEDDMRELLKIYQDISGFKTKGE